MMDSHDEDPEAAPGRLAVVEAFINTVELPGSQAGMGLPNETLSTPGDLERWFATRDLLEDDRRLTEFDLRWARDVREALRAILPPETGDRGPADPGAVETLNRAARGAQLQLVFGSGASAALEPSSGGADGAIGRLLAIVAGAMTTGTWERMRRCGNGTCQWAFYDHSKNSSANWCGLRCGNLMKARAYRARKREARL